MLTLTARRTSSRSIKRPPFDARAEGSLKKHEIGFDPGQLRADHHDRDVEEKNVDGHAARTDRAHGDVGGDREETPLREAIPTRR
ncbi:hypothetical protein A7982_13754 [Minicystis rosea]|nr:hypothetical protein A7982_13754 [Minicystis rosea]